MIDRSPVNGRKISSDCDIISVVDADPDPDPHGSWSAESGSALGKNDPEKRKTAKFTYVLKCWMFSFDD